MDRYVSLAVEYERNAKDAERSLGWLVPELVDAGLTMSEDTQGLRKWAGVIDGKTYDRFAGRWDLRNKAEHPNLMQAATDTLQATATPGMGWSGNSADGAQLCG